MNFKLNFPTPESGKNINLEDSILLIGSCFSDEIGDLLAQNKFKTLSNPFGTIYNPHSLFKLLSNQLSPANIIESQDVFYHWDAHGSISGLSTQAVARSFEQKREETQAFLADAKWLIVTFGTAHVYEFQNRSIVANCHKVESSKFNKRLIRQDEIIQQFTSLHSHVQQINPNLNILFTVSPVRHIRDGLIENNRSKAILIDIVHSLVNGFSNVSYFPSYEIVMDELRDYRFYAADMIHPSDQAIRYVWEKFSSSYFNTETRNILDEWNKLKSAMNHRSFQLHSNSHQKFLKSTLEKLEKMNEIIDVSVELEQLRNQIT